MQTPYYEIEVVNPLQKLASQYPNVELRALGGEPPVYLVKRGNSGLFVASVHHANEIFGTFQSVLEAISQGVEMSAVPVINTYGFNVMRYEFDKLLEMSGSNERLFLKYLYGCLVLGGEKTLMPEHLCQTLYPDWSYWNYGSQNGKKPEFAGEIEHAVASSSVVIDVHNCHSESYLLIAEPAESELQEDIETIAKDAIIRNGGTIGSEIGKYVNIRNGVHAPPNYHPKYKKTLIGCAKDNGVANLCLEVPVLYYDGNRFCMHEPQRIIATNVEILARIAEHLQA